MKSPVYVYQADLRRLKEQPAQAGFVSVDRYFNAGQKIFVHPLERKASASPKTSGRLYLCGTENARKR